jgi:hypothetical protein
VAVTESDELAQTARAVGLRLTPADVKALLPAWKRYRALVEELRKATTSDAVDA